MRLDLRTRLTAAVLAAIALLGLAAYFVGAQLIEDALIGAELDRAVDEVALDEELLVLLESDEAIFFEEGALIGEGTGFGPLEPDSIEEAIAESIEESIAQSIEGQASLEAQDAVIEAELERVVVEIVDDYAAQLDEAGLYEPMAVAANGSADQPVVVASLTAGWFEMSPDGSQPLGFEGPGDRALVGESVLVDATQLAEDITAGGGDPDGLALEVRFVRSESDGVDLLAVAEVSDTIANADALRDIILVSALVALLAGGLGAWLLTGRALRPVSAIIDRVDEISARTLHERVPEPSGDDEIAHLATTVNSMLDRIETGDRQRRQFVADASHELRTPVAVLRSDADLALRHPDRIEKAELATNVQAEAERLGRIVEDLLTLARQDEGRLAVAHAPVDLDDLVLEEAARTREVPIDIAAVGGAQVVGDAIALRRAIGHLIDNAARHATSKVAVAVSAGPDGAEVTVDDDGAGIPVADRHRIFERFTRLDEARNRDHGGAGLGLSVVAATAAAHRGNVTVTDSPLGGARFRLTLTEF